MLCITPWRVPSMRHGSPLARSGSFAIPQLLESTSSDPTTICLPRMCRWEWSTCSNWSGPLPNVPLRLPPVAFRAHELAGPLRLSELLDPNSLPQLSRRIIDGDQRPFEGCSPPASTGNLNSITICVVWKGYGHMNFRRKIDTRGCTITRAELAHAIAKVYDEFFKASRGVAYVPRHSGVAVINPVAASPSFYSMVDRLSLLGMRHLKEDLFCVDLGIWVN
ncbi:hypothetical protein C8Q79DRAFT_992975 [Trametes meyenii]|nr:hypothetical protein C8Q79DRAFT_992975 [Trametes meyenii]